MAVQIPSRFEVWWMAFRPKTLPAAATPVIVGSAAAWHAGRFAPGPFLAALVAALLIQIGSNLANDVFDFKKGADTAERLGPTRVTQAGLLSPEQVMRGMVVVFLIAVAIGVYLVMVGGWPIIAVGLSCIAAAIAYTGGPFPLGYHGLGDLFCFVFFGPVAVCGTYYVQALRVDPIAIGVSIPIGLLCTNILVVNNLRDIETDRKAGKRTLAVRLGQSMTISQYWLFGGFAYALPAILWALRIVSFPALLCWLTLAIFVPLARKIGETKGRALNPLLGKTAQLELQFGLLLAIGLILPS
jgi:1,4-dihydroxy-2-naphthoate polyprenyltransferase